MKKNLLFVAFLALLLVSAVKPPPIRMVRLTLINKSDKNIEVSLTGKSCDNEFYYLKVAKGNQLQPTEKIFIIMPDTYSLNTYYVELWDPVYGHQCSDKAATVDITHNTRVIVFNCNYTPPNAGDAHTVKLGGVSRSRHRPR